MPRVPESRDRGTRIIKRQFTGSRFAPGWWNCGRVYAFAGRPYVEQMHYQHVCLESLGYAVPDEIITSDDIERRLEPLYRRLRLPEGRLELMSGIRERRLWPRGMRPSEKSIESGRMAIEAAGVDPG